VHQERDLLRLERDLLRRELEAAQVREQAALEREQAVREREALLLCMVEQVQQQNQCLLDMPRILLPLRYQRLFEKSYPPFVKGAGGISGRLSQANPPSPPFAKGGMEPQTGNCMTLRLHRRPFLNSLSADPQVPRGDMCFRSAVDMTLYQC
jgi:hypothetical protein